jgi:hypothetical protein
MAQFHPQHVYVFLFFFTRCLISVERALVFSRCALQLRPRYVAFSHSIPRLIILSERLITTTSRNPTSHPPFKPSSRLFHVVRILHTAINHSAFVPHRRAY